MKILIASVFALALLGAGVASAEGVGVDVGAHVGNTGAGVGAHAGGNGVGVGAHVGDVGVGVGVRGHWRHRHCSRWGWRHHHHERYCRYWRHW